MSTRKPTAVLKLEKGKLYDIQRDRAALEPVAQSEVKPRCPRHFSRTERKVWKDFAAILANYSLFTAANSTRLNLLATLMVHYNELHAQWSDPVYQTLRGKIMREMRLVGKDISGHLDALGMSSIALAKIGSLRLKAQKDREEMFDD